MASPAGQVRGTRGGELKRPHGLRWLGFPLTRGLSGSATQGTQSQNGWLPREHAGTLHTSWRGYRLATVGGSLILHPRVRGSSDPVL